ncbi:MAG: ribosome small subunit-dependent GTPase A [Spirochaetaceae bacterium]|nr:MAG: ribosome small subunit-dependent GTPase A [Spirochaetaceae bacterium]
MRNDQDKQNRSGRRRRVSSRAGYPPALDPAVSARDDSTGPSIAHRYRLRTAKMRNDNPHGLVPWGWNAAVATRFAETGSPDGIPARVIMQERHVYTIVRAPQIESRARVAGAFEYRAATPSDYPMVGDWVVVDVEGTVVHAVIPRFSVLSRHGAGDETIEQVIAANIDAVFMVFGLDGGRAFSVGLLERLITIVRRSGARPIVVLNKSDSAEPETIAQIGREAELVAQGIPVHVVSAKSGHGLDSLVAEVVSGETVCLVGKSGVGKSSLLNALAGTRLEREGELRADMQGRHTTTHKGLYRLPSGILVIDVPGIRELQLWGDEWDVADSFPDIAAAAVACRFNDCSHTGEPGCAVQEALADGVISADRYDRYLDLQREAAFLRRQTDRRAREDERRKWMRITREQRMKKGARR